MSTQVRELRREPDGSYALAGAGTLRWQGWGRTRAVATVDGRSWRFERRGFWRPTAVAVPDGAPEDQVRVDEEVAGALPPLLQLFCCWLTILSVRDAGAAVAAAT